MKKTLLLLTMSVLGAAAIASPLDDKINAYNAMRKNTPRASDVDVRAILRNEVGVTSGNPTPTGSTCVICNIAATVQDNPGAGPALAASNPSVNPATVAASLLTSVPAGLGVMPGTILRTSTGTGASWASPDPYQDSRYSGYEAQYNAMKAAYTGNVIGIINSYMDPHTGKLAQMRVAVLNAVEQEMAAFAQSSPNASPAEKARYEASRIQSYSSVIASLTAQYENDIKIARDAFDRQMTEIRTLIENPPNNSGGN